MLPTPQFLWVLRAREEEGVEKGKEEALKGQREQAEQMDV